MEPETVFRPPEYFHAKGKTAESLVHDLARKTFLTDWCYLNPKLPTGKELCDLLVVFDDVAIIWQIKDLKLNNQGQYRKSEVEKNLRQLLGARRRLFDAGTPMVLKHPRRGTEGFDPTTVRRVYLISVLMGEGEDVFSPVEMIKAHMVHVFTREFTEVVLNELDAISDFTNYLQEKEAFLTEGRRLIILGGEEELLALYLLNNGGFDPVKDATGIVIEEGSWEHLQGRPDYKPKKEADKISYLWDSIIDRAHEGSAQYERVARELARPNRFYRRYLSKVFFEAYVRAHEDRKYDLFRRVLFGDGVNYCFLFADAPVPMERRREMLFAMCFVARGIYPKNRQVLGIATEKKIRPECPYDFCFLQMPEWTEKNQREMEILQENTGIFMRPEIGATREDEYPKRDS